MTHHSEFQKYLALAKNISSIFRTVYQKTPLKLNLYLRKMIFQIVHQDTKDLV